ncbi:cytidylyltransferase domain-containing protein [Bizionia sp.]|uniref:cytidylyltransferase domain-containing protein n=1 Tax=Bizionia sp. TaxID=1954480 RepID=UPI003A937138
MAVGHFNIGAIIQARLGSTRLPNKVLMPLPINSENTIISHIINQLKEVKLISKIVVASSSSEINDTLENYLKHLEVSCFRGDENDVLSRFYQINNLYNFDYIIRLTGDNPVIDRNYLIAFIENCIIQDLDYSYSNNLPLGCNFEIFKSKELVKVFSGAPSLYDKEHVTPSIRKNAADSSLYHFNLLGNTPELRLTIDYPTDYAFMEIIFSKLKDQEITIKKILKIIEQEPWLTEINKENYQKKEHDSLKAEIIDILPVVKGRELTKLENFLENVIKKNNL